MYSLYTRLDSRSLTFVFTWIPPLSMWVKVSLKGVFYLFLRFYVFFLTRMTF